MSKQKHKRSEKRREAKKCKRAIGRKAHVRSNSLDNIPARNPILFSSERKFSEVILEYAEPLTNSVEGAEREEKAIAMAITCWNASLLPKQEAFKTMESFFDKLAGSNEELKSELHSMFDMMYARKQNYFPADRRVIVNHSLEKNREGLCLRVMSAIS